MKRCIDPRCETPARMLTSAEQENLLSFNLSRAVCAKIFAGTLKGCCPEHAVKNLQDIEIDSFIVEVLRSQWNPYDNANFTNGAKYALCCECNNRLLRGNEDQKKTIDETLISLGIPAKRRRTIEWLTLHALRGFGTCFNCCLKLHTEHDLDKNLELIETYLDELAADEMK